MLQGLETARPIEIDALLTVVREMGRLVGVMTPHIDTILGLVQQLAGWLAIDSTFPRNPPLLCNDPCW